MCVCFTHTGQVLHTKACVCVFYSLARLATKSLNNFSYLALTTMFFSHFGQHLVTFLMISLQITKKNPVKFALFHTRDGLITVRRIVHPNLRPFHFRIKTFYPSDANYPTDNPSQTDNPSLVCRTRDTAIDTL